LKEIGTKLDNYEKKNNGKEAWRYIKDKFQYHEHASAIEMSDLLTFFTGTLLNMKKKDGLIVCKAFEMHCDHKHDKKSYKS